jgi:hypothetical protein
MLRKLLCACMQTKLEKQKGTRRKAVRWWLRAVDEHGCMELLRAGEGMGDLTRDALS